jgi:hypothetical protein
VVNTTVIVSLMIAGLVGAILTTRRLGRGAAHHVDQHPEVRGMIDAATRWQLTGGVRGPSSSGGLITF